MQAKGRMASVVSSPDTKMVVKVTGGQSMPF